MTCARAQVCGSYAVLVYTHAPHCHAGSPKRPKTSCRTREARQRVHLQASNQPNLPRCQSNVRAQRFHSGQQRTLHLIPLSCMNHVAGPRVCTLACQARPSSEWKSCTSMHSQHMLRRGSATQHRLSHAIAAFPPPCRRQEQRRKEQAECTFKPTLVGQQVLDFNGTRPPLTPLHLCVIEWHPLMPPLDDTSARIAR